MMTPSPLTELAGAVRRLKRQLAQVPERHRPEPADVFAHLDAAKRDVVELTDQGREAEARAVVADWAHEASARVATKLAHAPHEVAR